MGGAGSGSCPRGAIGGGPDDAAIADGDEGAAERGEGVEICGDGGCDGGPRGAVGGSANDATKADDDPTTVGVGDTAKRLACAGSGRIANPSGGVERRGDVTLITNGDVAPGSVADRVEPVGGRDREARPRDGVGRSQDAGAVADGEPLRIQEGHTVELHHGPVAAALGPSEAIGSRGDFPALADCDGEAVGRRASKTGGVQVKGEGAADEGGEIGGDDDALAVGGDDELRAVVGDAAEIVGDRGGRATRPFDAIGRGINAAGVADGDELAREQGYVVETLSNSGESDAGPGNAVGRGEDRARLADGDVGAEAAGDAGELLSNDGREWRAEAPVNPIRGNEDGAGVAAGEELVVGVGGRKEGLRRRGGARSPDDGVG